ncbi:cytochrome b561 domain-containing protein [uncultured Tateyamaria sp.]|uniref:cytochrome b561 domain-containing protein n=1 Tax=uncultured Tateyamaria sp. TaxID=455651 RepID=UPI00261B50C6|nr:cytochrome b561 domain-containing protein [uncultured Tateyamaria sp.]
MWDWLLSPMDAARAHEVGFAVSWHARSMVLGWGVLAPLAVLIARFFKVLPGQDFPREVDSLAWWRSHWIGQMAVMGLTALGFVLVLPVDFTRMSLHNWFGYGVLVLLTVQVLLGLFRGSKGGPTAPAPDGSLHGHHYDMTPWRLMFEALHKSIGYGLLLLGVITILLGLWKANGPNWMWLSLILWWAGLITAFVILQKRGMAIDTYQAIWGDDPAHPGNARPHPGWGVRRTTRKEDTDVRSDRRDRVRSH